MQVGYRAPMPDVPSATTSPAAPAMPLGHLTAGEPGPPPPGRSRTGVVWVHGIGDQKPGDSLFDWSRPILDTFAEWSPDHAALHKCWQNPIVRFGLMLVATPLAILVLAVYAALHAIPIPAISSRVRIAAADTFIVGWFADLAVILDDQSQSAAVRTRLLERVT